MIAGSPPSQAEGGGRGSHGRTAGGPPEDFLGADFGARASPEKKIGAGAPMGPGKGRGEEKEEGKEEAEEEEEEVVEEVEVEA